MSMRKKKWKALCLGLVFCMLAGFVPAYAAYEDVYAYDSYHGAVNRLGDLGILNGYTDGSFRPSDSLTRAEFAKMIVCAMDKESIAMTSGYSTPFFDVPQGYWAAPYINYVSKNGLIVGYSNGSFGPGSTITYGEAATIMLRILGYEEQDVGYFWPSNYVNKANVLDLAGGAELGAYQPLNRAQAAVIVDTALFSDVNEDAVGRTSAGISASAGLNGDSGSGAVSKSNGYEKDQTLLEYFGYTLLEDQILLSTSADNETLKWNEIELGDGNSYVYQTVNETYEPASLLQYVVLNQDNDIVAVKGNLKGEAGAQEMNRLGYTVLTNCHVIATSSQDRTLSSDQVRTNYGVYKAQNTDILSARGEVGTVILNKDKKVISSSTRDAGYVEYVVSEVNSDGIKYVCSNEIHKLDIKEDFPVCVDYGVKKNFHEVRDDFVAGAKLTLYTTDGVTYDYGVLDTGAGYSVVNECFIVATKNEDKSLTSDQVRTSNGTYKVKSNDILTRAGSIGTVVVDSSGKIEQFAPTDLQSLNVVANKVSDNEIEYIGELGVKGTVKLDSSFVTYVDYTKTTYGAAKNSIGIGTDMTLYGETAGAWEFIVVNSTEDITPVLATRDYTNNDTDVEGVLINPDNLTVYRDGKAASLGDICRNDVIYYNTKTNIMDVYNKKVTGIYDDAQPSKAYVTSVTVGGNAYEIGTITATAKLDASQGAYELGDKVTLLLGKNDKVVFVTELKGFNTFDYGVVINTSSSVKSSGEEQGKSEIKAKIFMPDGSIYEYVTDKDYSRYKGVLVNLKYSGGIVSLSRVTPNTTFSGTVDKANRTIGDRTVLKDVSILQVVDNQEATSEDAQVELLNFDTLEETALNADQIVNLVTANNFGDIGLMVVSGLTDTNYEYGVILGASSKEDSTSYTIYSNGSKDSYGYEGRYSVTLGGPVAFKSSGNKLSEIAALYRYASAGSIDAVEGSRIKINGKIYKMDSNVQIYKNDGSLSGTYSMLSLSELENAKVSSISIYSNRPVSKDGVIKVVMVTVK